MNKNIFVLEYSYISQYKRDIHTSTFFIGVFSSMEKAIEAVEEYKHILGFKERPEGFYTRKYSVNFSKNIRKLSGKILYHLEHCYYDENDYDNSEDIIFDFGFYEKRKECLDIIKRVKDINKIKNYPNDFYIYKIIIDVTKFWSEGFNTSDENGHDIDYCFYKF